MKENGEMIRWMAKVITNKILGIFYYNSGEKYDGEWKNGKTHGIGNVYIKIKGVFYYANGDKYDGEWGDGNFNGKGNV